MRKVIKEVRARIMEQTLLLASNVFRRIQYLKRLLD